MKGNYGVMNNKTLDYYNKNANLFIEGTISASMSETLELFLHHIPSGGKILDFGCGSGRDTRYFSEKGYQVEAIDGSEELCSAATLFSGIKVRQMNFMDLNEHQKYDGVWACASVLHLPVHELILALQKIADALKVGGVLYVSFKYGSFEGERNGRYFTDMTEIKMNDMLNHIQRFSLMKEWISDDIRKGRGNEKWLNLILKKID